MLCSIELQFNLFNFRAFPIIAFPQNYKNYNPHLDFFFLGGGGEGAFRYMLGEGGYNGKRPPFFFTQSKLIHQSIELFIWPHYFQQVLRFLWGFVGLYFDEFLFQPKNFDEKLYAAGAFFLQTSVVEWLILRKK